MFLSEIICGIMLLVCSVVVIVAQLLDNMPDGEGLLGEALQSAHPGQNNRARRVTILASVLCVCLLLYLLALGQ